MEPARESSSGVVVNGVPEHAEASLMMSFHQKRNAGERFYLALVDPLLPRVEYFALRKPRVTVGFLPDCDWTLPWASMGMDIIGDSRRFDSSFPSNACQSVMNSACLCAPQIGERRKEPVFEVTFHPTVGWTVSSPKGHGCRVGRIGEPQPFFEPEVHSHLVENDASVIQGLTNGCAFEFSWPYFHVQDFCGDYELPVQKLRFVFVACNVGDVRPVYPTRLPGERNLLSLPVEILGRIGSYLKPEEYLSTLGLVGRVFTSAEVKKFVPWTSVCLTSSFDSLRIVQLASRETVQNVVCRDHWNQEQKFAFYAKWEGLISHARNVKNLEVEDPRLLHGVSIPPDVRILRFFMRRRRNNFLRDLKPLRFPASIRCVMFGLPEGFSGGLHCVPSYTRLSPRWLFSAFPFLTDLRLHGVNCILEEWREIPSEVLQRITRVTCDPMPKGFPLARMPNVRCLKVGTDNTDSKQDETHPYNRLGGATFDSLEILTVKVPDADAESTALKRFQVFPSNAPKLLVIHIETMLQVDSDVLAELCLAYPRLEFICISPSVDGVPASVAMQALAKHLPKLSKDVEVSSTHAAGCSSQLPCQSPHQHPVTMLREARVEGNQDSFSYMFVYSRVSDAKRESATTLFIRSDRFLKDSIHDDDVSGAQAQAAQPRRCVWEGI